MNQHKQRLIVAAVILALVVPAIIGLSTTTVTVAFALLCIVALREWGSIVNKYSKGWQSIMYLISGVIATSAVVLFSLYNNHNIILYIAAGWWFLALVISTFYNTSYCSQIAFRGFLYIHIVIALAACIVAVHLLHQTGWQWLLYALILTAVSDSSAYYVGRRLGKNKLAPNISPGKSKEGLWGALVATLILSLLSATLLLEYVTAWDMLSLVLLSLVACIAGVIGDLTESMAKRCGGVKDSGKLLPGHGGVLDRVDAFLAVTPVIALGILYH